MISQIETIRKARLFLMEQTKNLSNEQFNQVAEGFNNNIIWNLGHMIATQQGMTYKRAGLPTVISVDFWEKFRTGSKPEGIVTDDEIANIKTNAEIDVKTDVEYNSVGDETEIEYDSIGNNFDQKMKALKAVLNQNKKKSQYMIT